MPHTVGELDHLEWDGFLSISQDTRQRRGTFTKGTPGWGGTPAALIPRHKTITRLLPALLSPQDPSYTPTRAQLSPLFPVPMAEPLLLLQPQHLSMPCSSWPCAYIAFAPSSTWVLTAIVSTCNSRAGPQPAFQSPVRSREIISFPSGVQTEKEGFSAVFSASPSCPPRWLPMGPMYIITSAGYI